MHIHITNLILININMNDIMHKHKRLAIVFMFRIYKQIETISYSYESYNNCNIRIYIIIHFII